VAAGEGGKPTAYLQRLSSRGLELLRREARNQAEGGDGNARPRAIDFGGRRAICKPVADATSFYCRLCATDIGL